MFLDGSDEVNMLEARNTDELNVQISLSGRILMDERHLDHFPFSLSLNFESKAQNLYNFNIIFVVQNSETEMIHQQSFKR